MSRTVCRRYFFEYAKFLIVGAFNTLFGYGIFAALLYLGLSYELAVPIGTVLGVLFNFHTTSRFVFDNQDPGRLPRFVLVYTAICSLNIIWLRFCEFLGINAYIGGAIATLPMALLTFISLRLFVYGNTKKIN